MDYVYYPDYLEHHGILGQKWGVRRYQNEDGSWTKEGMERRKSGKMTAKEYQQRLRQLDKRMQEDTIYSSMSLQGAEYANKKSAKYRDRNNTKKLEKSQGREKLYREQANILIDDYNKASKEFNSLLKEVESNGMAYMSRATNFNERMAGPAKRLVERESGRKFANPWVGWTTTPVNASSGNRISVRDRSSMSERKQQKYDRNKKINTYRPQSVEYYYY